MVHTASFRGISWKTRIQLIHSPYSGKYRREVRGGSYGPLSGKVTERWSKRGRKSFRSPLSGGIGAENYNNPARKWRGERSYLTQCIHLSVSESQLPHKTVNFIFWLVIINKKSTILWGSWLLKPFDKYIVWDKILVISTTHKWCCQDEMAQAPAHNLRNLQGLVGRRVFSLSHT